MRYFQAKISENRVLGGGYFVLRLSGCESLVQAKPGQFVMIRGAWGRDPLLPRAFSLLSAGPGDAAEILAKTVGRGTALLERALPGAELDVLGPLGNSFPEPRPDTTDLLVAGGVGLPPLYMQAAHAASRGQIAHSEMIYGGRRAADLVLLREMESMRLPLFLATENGEVGDEGLVTRTLEARLDHHRVDGAGLCPAESSREGPGTLPGFPANEGKSLRILSCGPNPMLWAVARIAQARGVPCFLSLEEQMACGIGVCLGCAIPARSRPFRYVCSNGPVFDATDVLDAAERPSPPLACPS